MKTLLINSFAITLLVAGFFVFWLPIPLGALMMAAGTMLLIGHSRAFALWLRKRRVRNPRFNGFVGALEAKVPAWIRDVLARTNPMQPLPARQRILDRIRNGQQIL